ncbi:hypothetical protein EAV90_30175 [Bradyrhizobium vignae]|nr:hypothetical protein EAV90_30175 [Bradyrhizobium vignae]
MPTPMRACGSGSACQRRRHDRNSLRSSLRAKRSNPESLRGDSLDCFVARAPRNDGARIHRRRSNARTPELNRRIP